MSPCEKLIDLPHAEWGGAASHGVAERACAGIEAGRVLFLPELSFACEAREATLFTPSILGSSKNASYDPATRKLGGTTATGSDADALQALIHRFSESAASLIEWLLPAYHGRIVRGRASFRPAEIAGRQSSWRKDDTRLHIDAFPSNPMHGTRLLRVFCNVNPGDEPRRWRVGEPFEAHAQRYLPAIPRPLLGSAWLMDAVGITKRRRTEYDHMMLQLHDRAKADAAFQSGSPQARVDFAPGTTWVVFSDQVLHAAMGGQHMMEQTFYLAPEHQHRPEASPLGILERLTGRTLR